MAESNENCTATDAFAGCLFESNEGCLALESECVQDCLAGGLTSGMAYRFRVMVTCSDKRMDSPWSAVSGEFKTLPGTLDKPTDLATAQTPGNADTQATLTWETEECKCGIVELGACAFKEWVITVEEVLSFDDTEALASSALRDPLLQDRDLRSFVLGVASGKELGCNRKYRFAIREVTESVIALIVTIHVSRYRKVVQQKSGS